MQYDAGERVYSSEQHGGNHIDASHSPVSRCVHETPIDGNAVKCAVLAARVAGPANPNYPCAACRAEWPADVPPDPDDRTTWTPTLLAFVEPFAEQLPAEPAPAPCFHLGRVLVQSCCNRKRVYACDLPDASGRERTTVLDCHECGAYDPDV